ncbi:MAG: DNRLRE domain-containing protein, partial [Verrucomicrobia bacterium]|nr:DNRLRE domain-containing protein [Verrucomicrobiota bacterium]
MTACTVRDLVNGISHLLGVTALDGATNESTRVEVSVTPIKLPPGSLMTNIFQKGVSPDAAYSQCLDSIFRQVDGDTFAMEALGKAPTMDPRMTNGTGTACIRFDLSSLPDNATVSEARLGIWFQPNDFDGSGSLVLHRLLDPDGTGMWAENNLVNEDAYDTDGASIDNSAMGSARFKRVGVPWSGTDGRYYDVINLATARTCAHAAGTPEWITFNVTDDLQAFVADSRLNLGWAFHSARDDSLRGELYLSDHSEAAKRAKLEVIYSGDTNVPPHHLPPLANAGLDQTLTDTDGNGWERVTLDGTASAAKEGTIVRYVWTLGEQLLASTALAQTHLSVGTNTVALAVWDGYNASNTDTATIIVLPAPSEPSGGPLTQRTIPPLSAILAASAVLHPGDIPEDTFQPPANAIYAAPATLGGNDANAGTSLSAPFEHLEKAIEYANEHPQIPLTIYLRGGVYYYKADSRHWYLEIERSNLYVTAYGSEPVTIRPSYWPGNPTASGDERVFAIYGPYSNITFANLDFEGWSIIFDVGCPYETAPLRNVTLKNIRARGFTHRDGIPDFQRVFLTIAYLTNDAYGAGKVIFDHPETAHFQIENLLLSRITVEDVDLAMNVGDENDANIKGLRISGFELNNPPQQATGTSASDGLAIVNCYKVLIDDCTIKNTADDGIDCKSYDV